MTRGTAFSGGFGKVENTSLLRAFACIGIAAGLLATTGPSAWAAGSTALPDAFRAEDVLWEVRLGTHQYTLPVVDGDRVYLGINDLKLEHPALEKTGGGILMCLERGTGELLWQQVIPRNMAGTRPPFHFNHWKCGVCSRPAIDGKRLYIVSPRGGVLCLDRNGQGDGNDGPFLDERSYTGLSEDSDYEWSPQDGDILWRFDFVAELEVVPHDVCGSTPLLLGNHVYACTSNGMDDKHRYVANPNAPSLVVLDKRTGRLAATDDEKIGTRLLHGQWSSPVYANFGGRETILFGGGDGILYAFKPLSDSATADRPRTLEKLWQRDCCPADYRHKNGKAIPYSRWNEKRLDGPSELIATPVVDRGRIYVAIGQSPVHGTGKGALSCIDGRTGERIWENRQVDRSLSDVAIHDGLLYVADFSGILRCLETDTGRQVWEHDLEGAVWTSSPFVFDGKVCVSTEKQLLWVLKADREKAVVARSRLRSPAITPVLDAGVLYLPTQQRLFAIRQGSEAALARR